MRLARPSAIGRPGSAPDGSGAARWLALGQGVYYAATGAWPLVSMRTFEAVTGPKRDRWLVKTVGLLIGVIGGSLSFAAARPPVAAPLALLGAASAGALGIVDVVYASRGRISRIYLLDAVAEAAIVAAWAAVGWNRRGPWARHRDARARAEAATRPATPAAPRRSRNASDPS
jgi:hypothetical protein